VSSTKECELGQDCGHEFFHNFVRRTKIGRGRCAVRTEADGQLDSVQLRVHSRLPVAPKPLWIKSGRPSVRHGNLDREPLVNAISIIS